jgi:bifunctional DNase/RNase
VAAGAAGEAGAGTGADSSMGRVVRMTGNDLVQVEVDGVRWGSGGRACGAPGRSSVTLRPVDAGERGVALSVPLDPVSATSLAATELAPPAALRRPLAHDLIQDVTYAYGATVVRAVLSAVEEGQVRACLLLMAGEHVLAVRCTAADAVATAVRLGVPLYARRAVLGAVAIAPPASLSPAPHLLRSA